MKENIYPTTQPIMLYVISKRELGDNIRDSVVLFDAINSAFEFEASQNPFVHVSSALAGNPSYKQMCRLMAVRSGLSVDKVYFEFLNEYDEDNFPHHPLYDELKIRINDFDIDGGLGQMPLLFDDNADYYQKCMACISEKFNIRACTSMTIDNIPSGSMIKISFFPQQNINLSQALKL